MPEGIDNASMAEILSGYVPRSDYDDMVNALNETATERDSHASELETHRGRLKEYETRHRSRAAKDAYSKAAEKLKVNPKFRDDVFKLAEIPADADDPDESALERHLAAFLEKRPDYIDQPPAVPPRPATLDRNESDGGRGRSVAPGEPEFRVHRRNMASAVWMRDNQAKFSQASKAGLLVIDDD